MRRTDPAIAAAVRATLRSRRTIAWITLVTAFGLVLTRVPLVGVLGYEHAFAVGFVMSIAGLDLGVAFVRRAQAIEAPALARATAPWRLVAQVAWRAAAIAAGVALIPAAIACVRGAWVPICDWGFGVRAELLLPVTTAVIAAGAGAACALVFARWWTCALALVGLWLAVAIAAAWRFVTEPPVFLYDAIVGYFPGNLYDQDVTLGWPLVFSRLEELLAVAAMLAAAAAVLDAPTLRRRRDRRPSGFRTLPWITAAALAAAVAAMHWQSARMGYDLDASDLEAELDGLRVTPHFAIHYARRPDIEEDMDLIAADHEFRYAQVVRTLGVEVDGRIDSYYFADADQKARLMGARTVEMAKPWERAIFDDHQAFPHPTLRHEIAHVVAGEFGDSLLHLSTRTPLHIPNVGMVEGLAVATDWPGSYGSTYTPDELVRTMEVNGVEPSLDSLFGLGFAWQSSGRAYMTAGSFLHYLLVRRGAPALRALYASGGDFDESYGSPRVALEAEWRAQLAQIQLPPEAIETGKEAFRRGGVFDVPCAHAVAAREAEAVDRLSEGDRAGAIALMRRVCADDPDEPDHQLALAKLLDAGDDRAEQAEGRAIFTRIAGDTDGTTAPVRARALVDLGEAAARDNDLPAADGFFTRALALPVTGGERRGIEAEAFALRHAGPAAPLLRGYFFGPGDKLVWATMITAVEPELGLGWYLRGLRAIDHDDHAGAADDLAHALALGLPGPRFVSNAARVLAVEAWRAGDHAKVAQAADVLASTGNEVERLLADDWRQRIEFAVSGALPPITSR